MGHGEIPYYSDSFMVPCPAIRFKEVDEELGKLREKEKGDWKLLTLEEKKTCKHLKTSYNLEHCLKILSIKQSYHLTAFDITVYRASFNSTLEEVRAPSGDWKRCLGDNAILIGIMFFGLSVIGLSGKFLFCTLKVLLFRGCL